MIPCNKLHDILKEVRLGLSWNKWLNKEVIIFNLQAKYGGCFDRIAAGRVYDELVLQEMIKREENQ